MPWVLIGIGFGIAYLLREKEAPSPVREEPAASVTRDTGELVTSGGVEATPPAAGVEGGEVVLSPAPELLHVEALPPIVADAPPGYVPLVTAPAPRRGKPRTRGQVSA